MTAVKICGLKTVEDSRAACRFGADWIGLNFYPKSVRYIQGDLAKKISQTIKAEFPQVVRVGVFVNSSPSEVETILDACELDVAQLAGDEVMQDYRHLEGRVFKAYRDGTLSALMEKLARDGVRQSAPAFLLDASQKGFGGGGELGDWTIANHVKQHHSILLAGGLNPSNVSSAIQAVQPWGVDVASGVESVRGVKDQELIRLFIENVRAVDRVTDELKKV